MNKNTGESIFTIVLLFCIAIASAATGSMIGSRIMERHWQNECIERNFAIYHPKTKAFTWKEDLEK